jgi:hypothetical protein
MRRAPQHDSSRRCPALSQGSWCAPASALIVKMNTCFNDNGVWLAAVLPCRLHWAQHMHAVMLALVQGRTPWAGLWAVGCCMWYVRHLALEWWTGVWPREIRVEKRPKKSRRRRLCSHWSPINNSRHNLLSTPLSTTPYTNMNTILPSTLSPSARWSYHVRWSLRLVYSVRRGNRLRHHTRAPPLPPPPGPAFAGPSKKAAHIEIHTR